MKLVGLIMPGTNVSCPGGSAGVIAGTSEVRLTHGPLGHGTHPATIAVANISPAVNAVT